MNQFSDINISGSITKKSLEYPEPIANQKPKQFVMHGDVWEDNYYWMNERENPEVKSYLQKENDYLEHVLEPVKELREKLYNELVSRIKQDDNTVPYTKNGYSYYTRYETGKEYAIYCRKKIAKEESPEEIMLNVNDLAKGKKFCNVIPPKASPDNMLIVYGLDTTGRNLHTAYVKNLVSGDIVEQNSPVVAGDFVWTPDSKAFFYDTKDIQTLRTDKVWLHLLGQAFDKDQLIYHEEDETSYASISSSKDRAYLFIQSGYTETIECQFIPLNDYHAKPIIIKKRQADFYYSMEHFQGAFLILTNDHAKNFKLVRTAVDQYQYEHWQDLISHQQDVLLEDVEVFDEWLVLRERRNGLNQVHILPWSNLKNGHYIEFRDASYDCWLGSNYEMSSDTLRIVYTSLTTPISTYDYNMHTKELLLLKENPVLGNFNKENYHSQYIQVKSRDGVDIPMTLVYRKGFNQDGSAPAVLYSYGSYGISMDASFSSNILSLLDRGFIYAIAHIRGGKEKGWQWYEDGKMMKKINTFNDYIDCAEYLIKQKYTSSDRLFGRGGSAGGLLMGAIYNMRPELFKGLLAHVPFVDVITTMSDPDIPLTTGEYTEWGNPEHQNEYEYMKKYSPVDNVVAKKYTNLLVTTGFSDSQVQYWEPAKWVAKIRKLRTDKNDVVLFYTNLDAGHGGASGRFERLKEIAMEYAFMFGLLVESNRL
jgi:oligopeptidase B